MTEPSTPEELEFRTEEGRLLEIIQNYPRPTIFKLPSLGVHALRKRLKTALRYFLQHPEWDSIIDREQAFLINHSYTFVVDDTRTLYVGLQRRTRIEIPPAKPIELPLVETENPEIVKAFLLLKDFDFFPYPVKIKTTLPIHELKADYYNTEVNDSITPNTYTIL